MKIKNNTTGIIGCGNMGSALIENLKKSHFVQDIFVFDKVFEKPQSLVARYGVKQCLNIEDLKEKSEILVIAVKPQDIDGVLMQLKGSVGKLVISIAAGITLDFLESFLGKDVSIVRAMPNINALIAKGVTGICANKSAGQEGLKVAYDIFSTVGDVVFVNDSEMNAVTAVSGSGPAFVAYLFPSLSVEAINKVFVKEALSFGISNEKAEILAASTTSGTLAMINTNFDASMLIKRVCSKGGTTEAGMKVLEKKEKNEAALSEAIRAAEKRAQELARRR